MSGQTVLAWWRKTAVVVVVVATAIGELTLTQEGGGAGSSPENPEKYAYCIAHHGALANAREQIRGNSIQHHYE